MGRRMIDTPTADQIAAADDMADYAVTHADELAAMDAAARGDEA